MNVGINATYTDNSVKSGDVILCMVTSNNSCATTSSASSNAITITVNPVIPPTITISASSNNICYNTPVTLTATVANAGSNLSYQWKKNGIIVGTNSSTYTSNTFFNGDAITCILTSTSPCNQTSVTSNVVTILLKQEITPEVTVAASASTLCTGTNITFTATNKSGNPNPAYQWIVDGKDVGTNSTVYNTSSLTNGSVVQCRMTVPQCIGTTKDYSDPITITVNPILNPSVNISSTSNNICKGTPVTFTATATQAGTNPSYQWKINGNNVSSGGNTFISSTINDGDIISCILAINPAVMCAQNSIVTSNSIPIKVTTIVRASVSISASANDICGSSPITFLASVQNAGNSPSYTWLLNGSKVGMDSLSYTNTLPLDKDQVKLVLSSANPACSTVSTDTSNTITIIVRQLPGVVLTPLDTTVTIGAQIQFAAAITGSNNSFTWSPAASLTNAQTLSPLTIPIQATTNFKLEVVSANGCRVSKEAVVRIITSLWMPNSFTPNGDGKNDLFKIPAGVSLNLKEFSVYNRWGIKVFSTGDITKGWNGTYKGVTLDPGAYIFVINGLDYQNKNVFVKGTVLLLR